MSKNHEQEKEIRQSVRDVLALNPTISSRKLADAISKKTNLPVSQGYILKIMHKASKEAIVQTDMLQAIEHVAKMSERFRMIVERMQKIIFAEDGKVEDKDRIRAAQTIASMERTLFLTLQDAGVFKKQPKEVKHSLTVELSEEMKVIMQTARNWKITRPPSSGPAPEPVIMVDAAVVESSTGEVLKETNEPSTPKIFKAGAVTTPKQDALPPRADAGARLAAILEQNSPQPAK